MVGAPARSPTQLCEIRARSGRDSTVRTISACTCAPPTACMCLCEPAGGLYLCEGRSCVRSACHTHIHTHIHIHIHKHIHTCAKVDRAYDQRAIHTYIYIYIYIHTCAKADRAYDQRTTRRDVGERLARRRRRIKCRAIEAEGCLQVYACMCMHACVRVYACMYACMCNVSVCVQSRQGAACRWQVGAGWDRWLLTDLLRTQPDLLRTHLLRTHPDLLRTHLGLALTDLLRTYLDLLRTLYLGLARVRRDAMR